MKIRQTREEELDEVMEIYRRAAAFMAESGNPNQWVNGYPDRELIAGDIKKGKSFVMEQKGGIVGAFTFLIGEDPTYREITQGAWLSDEPYGTIHRLAATGTERGIG